MVSELHSHSLLGKVNKPDCAEMCQNSIVASVAEMKHRDSVPCEVLTSSRDSERKYPFSSDLGIGRAGRPRVQGDLGGENRTVLSCGRESRGVSHGQLRPGEPGSG